LAGRKRGLRQCEVDAGFVVGSSFAFGGQAIDEAVAGEVDGLVARVEELDEFVTCGLARAVLVGVALFARRDGVEDFGDDGVGAVEGGGVGRVRDNWDEDDERANGTRTTC
jgi:hypothetical protein